MQYWKSESIYEVKCPQCSQMVEFYKDDPSRKCGHCGHRFVNPKMDFGCASYCQFAEQCLGTLPEEFLAQKDNLLKDRVAVEVKKYLKNDFKSISHATRVARHAERIGKSEGANLAIILCSSYLQNIGRNEALQKYGAATDDTIEKESVAAAEAILTKLGANEQLVNKVCDIIAPHRRPGTESSAEFNVVHDAQLIAGFAEKHKNASIDQDEFHELVDTLLRTEGGRGEARETLAKMGIM
jgi:DNA-directed RNA polymerase subunit RPC12/RpoP